MCFQEGCLVKDWHVQSSYHLEEWIRIQWLISKLAHGLELNILLEFCNKNWDDLWNHKSRKDPRNTVPFCGGCEFFTKEIVGL